MVTLLLLKRTYLKKPRSALLRSFVSVSPPPEVYNKLFDTLVKPVALYNCEIWATNNVNRLTKYDSKKLYELSENDLHERLHTKIFKSNLRVKRNSVNTARSISPDTGCKHTDHQIPRLFR